MNEEDITNNPENESPETIMTDEEIEFLYSQEKEEEQYSYWGEWKRM